MLAEVEIADVRLSAAAERLCEFAVWEVTVREPFFLCDAAHIVISGMRDKRFAIARILQENHFNAYLARRIARPWINQSKQRPIDGGLVFTAAYKRAQLRAIDLAEAGRSNEITEVHQVAGALLSGGRIINEFFKYFEASPDDLLDQLQVNWRDIEIPRRQPYVTR